MMLVRTPVSSSSSSVSAVKEPLTLFGSISVSTLSSWLEVTA